MLGYEDIIEIVQEAFADVIALPALEQRRRGSGP